MSSLKDRVEEFLVSEEGKRPTEEELTRLFDDLHVLDARVGDLFIHYKQLNNETGPKHVYQIVALSMDAETLERLITYQDLSCPEKTWTRKASSFLGEAELPTGKVPRFRCVGWAPLQPQR